MHTKFYWLNKFWEIVPAFLKSHTGKAKNKEMMRIIVPVFICTFGLTALFLKSFHFRLHCYILIYTVIMWISGTEIIHLPIVVQLKLILLVIVCD